MAAESSYGVGVFQILENLTVVRKAYYQESPAKQFKGAAFSNKYSNVAIASSNDDTIYILKVDNSTYNITLLEKKLFSGKLFYNVAMNLDDIGVAVDFNLVEVVAVRLGVDVAT